MEDNYNQWKVSCRLNEKSPIVQFQYLGYANEVFSEIERNLGSQYAIVRFEKIDFSKTYKNKESIFKDIKKYLKIPYIWGGDNPKNGFDCSGFVQYIFKQIGINLPRTSYEQYDISEEVEFYNIKIGDLLFNKEKSDVGIYIGDGEFIHASYIDNVVKIDKLFDSNMMIIRRVIEEKIFDNPTTFIFDTLINKVREVGYEMSYGRKETNDTYYIKIKDNNGEIKYYRLIED